MTSVAERPSPSFYGVLQGLRALHQLVHEACITMGTEINPVTGLVRLCSTVAVQRLRSLLRSLPRAYGLRHKVKRRLSSWWIPARFGPRPMPRPSLSRGRTLGSTARTRAAHCQGDLCGSGRRGASRLPPRPTATDHPLDEALS